MSAAKHRGLPDGLRTQATRRTWQAMSLRGALQTVSYTSGTREERFVGKASEVEANSLKELARGDLFLTGEMIFLARGEKK